MFHEPFVMWCFFFFLSGRRLTPPPTLDTTILANDNSVVILEANSDNAASETEQTVNRLPVFDGNWDTDV